MSTETTSTVSAQQIKDWKEKYRKVFSYKVKDGRTAYFRNPTIVELEAHIAVGDSGKTIQANKVLAQSVFLGGDKSITEEEATILGLGKIMTQIVDRVEGELTEL